ncbi:16S rRNA (guanine(527)-N(7))-methyltransferase RsmG [Burkholderia sp. SG-MS1]|uniref:16S rRNA (guanine(527)-N(7))-methyltransferase RsmG n=1 Tax=Paraburkholderia sp. SG-MS1 TaxID=2023741 RepID=UPI0014454AE1|nr:16S rRNA (guanine(527)-N(7))-methyltransferase RsmG [Paraburkholderia sp. SG-MS1]NKJ49432.1 16S rRNA (guanine(527)-N(7))-methyltransferase RsmG [Paraburkholderia sp. SG-MS1]
MTASQKSSIQQALAPLLADGVRELGLDLSDTQRGKLLDYVALLSKWNAVYNLTAIRDPRQMLIQHILDSLSIVSHLAPRGPSSVLDVGSGGGLPGIVLAIVLPDWTVTVNDIVHKKTAFQSQAKAELGLANLLVVTGRVEVLRQGAEVPAKFDVIVSRAFAELADFVTLARHLVAEQGAIWAMKGVRPEGEIERLPAGAHAEQIIRLQVPFLDAERHLIKVLVDADN